MTKRQFRKLPKEIRKKIKKWRRAKRIRDQITRDEVAILMKCDWD